MGLVITVGPLKDVIIFFGLNWFGLDVIQYWHHHKLLGCKKQKFTCAAESTVFIGEHIGLASSLKRLELILTSPRKGNLSKSAWLQEKLTS